MVDRIFRNGIRFAFLSLLIFALSGCRSSSDDARASRKAWNAQLKDLCQGVARDNAVVRRTSSAGVGAPVLVLEETHDSRPSLIENAIVLTRLHARYGVTKIALEGYLQDEPQLDSSWFNRLPGTTPMERADIAARLLEEGEISAPEFMTLVYPDIELIPAEVGSEYKVNMREGALQAALELARRSDSQTGKEFSERIANGIREPISAEDELKMAEELEKLRLSRTISLSPESLSDWQSWIGYWRGRAAGNTTMANAVLMASTDAGLPPVILNTGVAHTEGIILKLRNANRPYAVITPLALHNNDQRGRIEKNYPLREERKSVQPNGAFMTAIYTAGGTKPQAVINESWLQMKALVNVFTEEIAINTLGAEQLQGDANTPHAFSPGQFDTKWIHVDTNSIAVVQDGNHRDVVFSFILRPIHEGNPSAYWMKATLDPNRQEQTDEAGSIEALLKKALSQAQLESDAPSQAEDSSGVIIIGENVRAVFGSTREAVIARSLHTQP